MNFAEMTFPDFIRIWARVALILVLVEAYLTVNKIWTRKHEAVVSESISVSAQFIALATGVPFVALYALEGAYEGVFADGIFLFVNLIMIMIGIGVWVEGRRGESFGARLRRALKMERREASNLVRTMFRPAGAEQVIAILQALAMIDNELDAKERRFVQDFADEWGVDADPGDNISQGSRAAAYMQLRSLVEEYLAASPPREQARHLGEIMDALVAVDGSVSSAESLVMEEISGLLGSYTGNSPASRHVVFIAPQNQNQELNLQELMPHLTKEVRLGGEVFKIGAYYSAAYAAMICERYRDSGFLTVNLEETD